jgi:ribosome maturation factor RimP
MSSTETIRELTEPLLAGTGLELWDVELAKGVVRILVDREGGVDLEALTEASHALSGVFDDHPEVAPGDAYQLEVSSPGLERTLRHPDQYRRYLGALVSIKTTVAVDGSRRWRGTLVAVDEDRVVIAPEGAAPPHESVTLGYDQIDRTRTVLVWGPTSPSAATDGGNKQAGGSARWSDPRPRTGARRAARSGTEVKETS